MNNRTLVVLACLVASFPSAASAKIRQPQGGNHVHTNGDAIAKAEDAREAYQSAEAACSRSRSAYESKAFSGGSHDAEELRTKSRDKDSACNQATGAHTAYLNALHAAAQEYRGRAEEAKKSYEKVSKDPKASKDEKADAKRDLDEADRAVTKIDLEIAKNSANNNGGRGKH